MTAIRTPIVKITRPVPDKAFPRKRLFRLLDRFRKCPIVWVSGPPGCGKTTLVGSYLSIRGDPCLWYRVDEGDQDIASFFYYLGLAARRAAPEKRKPLPLLAPEYLAGLSTFTRRYFENLFGRLKAGSVLVFDDYQKIPPESPLHEVIRDGLTCLPKGMNAIVIGRSGPPTLFARNRVHRQMALIGWKDLRLTFGETEGIARLRGRKRRSAEEFRYLQRRSEGWVAGLVLLLDKSGETLAPQNLKDHPPEEVFEYFASEIFDGLKEDAKIFLLKSAFLPKMTARMAEKITGQRRAGTILFSLNRHNYFTDLHMAAEPVYEYHPLFRDFLRSRAGDVFPANVLRRLRSRAGAILVESGHDDEALEIFGGLGDWGGVVRILLKQAAGLIRQGRSGRLSERIASLPKDVFEEDPWLLYWMGVCRLHSQPGDSRRDFEEAYRRFRRRKEPDGVFLAWSGVVDAIVHGPGDLKSLDPWFSTLADLLKGGRKFPSPGVETQVTCTLMKALALRRPSFVDMEMWADRATGLAGSTRDLPLKFSLLLNTAYYRFHGGDFQAVGILLESLRGLSRNPDLSPLPRLALCWLGAAHANVKGLHDRCLKVVTEGIELAEATGVHLMDLLLMGHGALCSLHQGDATAAKGFLDRMASSLASAKPWEASFYHHLAAWEALHRGDVSRATFHSDRCLEICEEVGNPWTEAMGALEKAIVRHQTGESAEASRNLERAIRVGEEGRMPFVRFACLLAKAYFAFRKGDDAAGLASLREGIRLGREKGYVDIYLWYPGLLERIAAEALERGIETDYVRELVRKNALVPEGALQDIEQWPWPLKVYTLGRFELAKDGKPLPFSRKVQQKPLLMLKALISMGGREVAEERITDALWPDAEGDLAHQSFSMTLSRLRRLLGNEKAIQLREGRLTLDSRYCWVDAFAFESRIEKADVVPHVGRECPNRSQASCLAARAVTLYGGSFLAGEGSRPWITASRERLRSKFLRAVGLLGHCLEEGGRWTEAIAAYRKGLEVDDLAEEFYRRLILCHRRLGQEAEALGVYARCRKTLAAVLGIPPSPETTAVAKPLL